MRALRRLARLVPTLALLFVGAGTVGCGSKTATESVDSDSQALAEDGTDTTGAESDSETLVTSFLSPASLAVASDTTTASGFYHPAGCLTVTSSAAGSATYTLDHCTGPLGLLTITGAVSVSWTTSAGSLALTISAISPMEFNRATVSTWTATATLTESGANRTMQWDASLAGTTARGREFTRTNHKTLTWTLGASCVTVNGASDGQVAARDLATTITGYERCGGCPRAGTIAATNRTTGRTISLAFDGSDEATFTAANGAQSSIALACTP